MAGLKTEGVNIVRVELRRPHVLPHALLQSRLTADNGLSTRYSKVSQDENGMRFEPTSGGTGEEDLRPVIVERFYPAPREAIAALRKGKIDMIDRVLPNDALRLRQDPTLVVGQYAFPSIHVLVPNTDNPYLNNRTFRRALVYGINRQVILEKGLLNMKEVPGCRVLSVPFPAGVTENDPSAYAYDDGIEARGYDPVMAAILMSLAEKQLGAAADMREETAPELGELVIAHPPFEIPRFVCTQIQTQLDIVGIKCTLSELPLGRTTDPNREYDLLYLELAMREPLVDVRRIFGPDGTAPSTDPFVGLTLRQLDEAESWKDASELLHKLHRQIHEEVTVIPLWQMVDHFVYHGGLGGVKNRPVFLYQDVDQWRVVPPELKE
jgi:ABC-type transport system substrate-binding protein